MLVSSPCSEGRLAHPYSFNPMNDFYDHRVRGVYRTSKRPLLLDLFSGGGGASMGYYQAGFDVLGVDKERQKNYPFGFIKADVMTWLPEMIDSGRIERFDVIACSPPCQRYSVTAGMPNVDGESHPDLVGLVRELLKESGKPYIIENVVGAPLENPLMLCGSMFPGLRVYRHRLFECRPEIWFPPAACNHSFSMPPSKGAYHTLEGQEFITCVGHNFKASDGRIAMGIPWMTRKELSQAIPPAYTRWLGTQMLKAIGWTQ